jgi:hypothetical protein
MDIFYKILRSEFRKNHTALYNHLYMGIPQTLSAGSYYSHTGPYSSITQSWCNQLWLRYLRTQSRPTHGFRPTTIIKPPPLHHSHFIQHSAVCGHTTTILTYDIKHEGPCSNHLPTMVKGQKDPMKRRHIPDEIRLQSCFPWLRLVIKDNVCLFSCIYLQTIHWKPTHPFGGAVLRKVKNFCSHFGSELNEMFHQKSKPRSKIN